MKGEKLIKIVDDALIIRIFYIQKEDNILLGYT